MSNPSAPYGVPVPHPAMMPQEGMQGPTAMMNPLGFYAPITDPGWIAALQAEFSKDYFQKLALQLQKDYTNKQIYPPQELIFNAFNLTPLDQVKVVILGQDPYHKAGKAMGLSFSVPMGIKPPRSLKNIYNELEHDKNIKEFTIPDHGCLEKWAKQGVLLLNTVLTVEEGNPDSHAKYGWEEFTDAVIKIISDKYSGIVFMLWGNVAAMKQSLIDPLKHKIIITSHPSPRATQNLKPDKQRFYGSDCFSNANAYLISMGKTPIKWSL